MRVAMKDGGKQRKGALQDHLKMSILTLELRPGQDLDEAHLTEAFGLSRTPLREVFREMAGEGYLDIRAGRGVRVSEMSHTTLRDFFQAAPMIYGAILRLAAQNASDLQIEALEQAQEAFKAALQSGSGTDRALANNRFHEVTGEMAGNIFLLPSFNRLLIDHARISMTFYRPQDDAMVRNVSEASRQHEDIINAIRAGDAETAGALADAHWNLSRHQIEKFVMPTALDLPLGSLSQSKPA